MQTDQSCSSSSSAVDGIDNWVDYLDEEHKQFAPFPNLNTLCLSPPTVPHVISDMFIEKVKAEIANLHMAKWEREILHDVKTAIEMEQKTLIRRFYQLGNIPNDRLVIDAAVERFKLAFPSVEYEEEDNVIVFHL